MQKCCYLSYSSTEYQNIIEQIVIDDLILELLTLNLYDSFQMKLIKTS